MLDDDAAFTEEVDRQLLELLDEKCGGENTSAHWYVMLAGVLRRRENPQRAIECYETALNMNYGQVQWRLNLAQLLAEQGQVVEAVRQAEICLRLSPGLRDAQRLIERLSSARAPRLPGH